VSEYFHATFDASPPGELAKVSYVFPVDSTGYLGFKIFHDSIYKWTAWLSRLPSTELFFPRKPVQRYSYCSTHFKMAGFTNKYHAGTAAQSPNMASQTRDSIAVRCPHNRAPFEAINRTQHCSSAVPMPCMIKLRKDCFPGTLPATGRCPPAFHYAWYFPAPTEVRAHEECVGLPT
jgi:hypothetical protein